ncbi:MAG: ATP-dependent Clp protease ATP-binding subunit [Candidatus Brennerbacteria bacterium]
MTNIFFRDARFGFSTGGEFLVRLFTAVSYAALIGAAVVLLTTDAVSARALGVFIALFLIDRVFHLREGERTLAEFKEGSVNVRQALTPAAYRVFQRSFRYALGAGKNFSLVFLSNLSHRSDIKESLRRLGVRPDVFAKEVGTLLSSEEGKGNESKEELLKEAETLAVRAYYVALGTEERFVEPRSFFAALAAHPKAPLPNLFGLHEISSEDAIEAVVFGRFRRTFSGLRRIPAVLGGFAHHSRTLRKRAMNRAWTARPTPTLDQYSIDLTNLARAEEVGFLIGHEKEFEHLLQVLARPGKPNALLVGEPGVGKSTMVAHLAFRIIKDRVPPALFDRRLVELHVGALVGDVAPEEAAGRMKKIVEEVLAAGNVVLSIPNVHELFYTKEKRGIDPINMLLPILGSESIPVIAETFPKEFKQIIESRSDFMEQFEKVEVDEITPAEATRFLTYTSLLLEREFNITVTFRAVRKAVELAHRYFATRILPGSALDLLKQALAKASAEDARELGESHIIAVAERQSKVPIEAASEKEAEKLLNLESIIHERLVNQEAAVKAVSRALREYRSGLTRKGGPIATFLFVGPTGVGKTELAKILTKVQFNTASAMHRFDMSEFQTKDSIQRFIGNPDGSRTGALTDAVRALPYSLILLDEFEKAHPDILNLFLQVFDDGRLTDSLGRTADFTNTIIIATSNAHSDFIKEEIEKGNKSEDIALELKKRLTTYFKPELINRFSDIIVFRNLMQSEVEKIAAILIQEVSDTLREAHGINLTIHESAVAEVARRGWSPVFGARPLRQAISEHVKGVLAEKILRRELVRGMKISLVYEGEAFVFQNHS